MFAPFALRIAHRVEALLAKLEKGVSVSTRVRGLWRSLQRFRRGETSFHEGANFLGRWTLLGALIGLAAGLGALALIFAVRLVSAFALGTVVGYEPPAPAAEGGSAVFVFHMARPWALPLVTATAGLVGGLIVWRFAPSNAGIGTNAAIDSFHKNEDIPLKTALLKVGTSAITIGGGLTSGREGPIAQIGAGAGTTVARLFKLTARERNIALAAGLGAGIAAMFKAPLAGAIIGAEIFYTEDFEVEALIPAIIASVVGYTLVGYVVGFAPIFSTGQNPAQFNHPASLLLYAALGLICAVGARIAIATFFATQSRFRRIPLPLATMIGGALTGLIALLIPSVIGTGYGWAQFALLQDYTLLAPVMLLAAAAAEVLCASLTLGSGNSGGIFGPSVVTGAMLGAAFGFVANLAFPSIAGPPANYAIVGMMAFFAASAKAPISTIVMIAEMTGGYGLLGPSMFAVITAFLLSGKRSIFPAQVRNRLESAFHRQSFEPMRLRQLRVADAMTQDPVTLPPDAAIETAVGIMENGRFGAIPITEDGRLVGILRRRDALRCHPSERHSVNVSQRMLTQPATATPDEDLYEVLQRLAVEATSHFGVVDKNGQLVGILARRDIGRAVKRERDKAQDAASRVGLAGS